ncbi:MAG: helix-turn-helix transcriptional regulator [Lachnospiraceae bacterium]|jgi:transcriptional regulator with XRE-family HTH domain|nr:helix-turn-helix transcriptional regulator [Lachnospiraceae bacterium]
MEEETIRNDDIICIGTNIRDIRIRRHMGQTQLVRLLQLQGVSITREALVKIERGVQHIKVSQLRAIRECLEVSYEELIQETASLPR